MPTPSSCAGPLVGPRLAWLVLPLFCGGLALAAGAQPATSPELPTPAEYPAATAGCTTRQKIQTKFTGAYVDFPNTFECRIVVHAVCDRKLREVRSGTRAHARGVCDDYVAAAAALQGREACCDESQGTRGAPAPVARDAGDAEPSGGGRAAPPPSDAAAKTREAEDRNGHEEGNAGVITGLEPGRWKLRVTSTTNARPDPAQDQEQCLGGAELADLGALFAPALEGAQADCTSTREPSDDPNLITTHMRCVGAEFEVDSTTSVTIAGPHRFDVAVWSDARTTEETSAVSATIEGRWNGACEPPSR